MKHLNNNQLYSEFNQGIVMGLLWGGDSHACNPTCPKADCAQLTKTGDFHCGQVSCHTREKLMESVCNSIATNHLKCGEIKVEAVNCGDYTCNNAAPVNNICKNTCLQVKNDCSSCFDVSMLDYV